MRFRLLILSGLIVNMLAPLAVHAASPSLVISEIQTGSATNAGQEFVELYNSADSDVVVDGWLLQYKSATSAIAETSWTKRADLKGTVRSHGFYLISQKAYLAGADADLSTSGLSGTAGHVRIKDNTGVVIDVVGWGSTANASETAPAAAPAAGQSIERLPGRLNEIGGNATDIDDNSSDFVIRATPGPQSTMADLEVPGAVAPVDPTTPTDPVVVDDPAAPATPTYLPVLITEIFPDPAAPLTDANDEFIELYNPNDTAVNVEGYTLRAGSNFHDFYILPAGSIDAGGYLVIYSRDSHIALTNTGSSVDLLDPAGTEVATVPGYGQSATGESWDLFDNDWKWTLQTTPGADNVLVVPVAAVKLPKSTATTAKKATTTAAKTTKVAAAKTTSPKTSTKKATSAKAPLIAAATKASSAGWLLIGLAALSMGYAIYEFRHDIQNHYHISKRNLRVRRAARKST